MTDQVVESKVFHFTFFVQNPEESPEEIREEVGESVNDLAKRGILLKDLLKRPEAHTALREMSNLKLAPFIPWAHLHEFSIYPPEIFLQTQEGVGAWTGHLFRIRYHLPTGLFK